MLKYVVHLQEAWGPMYFITQSIDMYLYTTDAEWVSKNHAEKMWMDQWTMWITGCGLINMVSPQIRDLPEASLLQLCV